MEKKLTNSGPLREPADKHSIYTMHKEILEGPFDEVGCGINEVLTELMKMFLLGIGDLLFVLLELCHHLTVRRERFGMLQ